jgi:hypothetical protein
MRLGKITAFVLIALCLASAVWTYAGSANPTGTDAPVALAAYADGALTGDGGADAKSPEMSAWIKTAQARCPPGQLVFLTNACGCNGACCACSAQAPYLDNCSCKCSATQPTTCNRGYSAGRR